MIYYMAFRFKESRTVAHPTPVSLFFLYFYLIKKKKEEKIAVGDMTPSVTITAPPRTSSSEHVPGSD